jgi:hypothetical protein
VKLPHPLGRVAPAERARTIGGLDAQAVGQRSVGNHPRDRGSETLRVTDGIVALDNKSSTPTNLDERGVIRVDDGRSELERFDEGEPESFGKTGVDENCCSSEYDGEVLVTQYAEGLHAAFREPGSRGKPLNTDIAPSLRSNDQERQFPILE